jgi:hypothetical protein
VDARIGTVQSRAPAAESLLLNVIGHGAKSADGGIRWVADAWFVIQHGTVAWDRVAEEAIARRYAVRTRACLAYLRAALDVPIPAAVMERLWAVRVGLSERLEHQVRTRGHRRLGLLPDYWFGYARTRSTGSVPSPSGFASYLQAAWGLDSRGEVPRAAIDRVAARLRDQRPPEGPPDGEVLAEQARGEREVRPKLRPQVTLKVH